MTEDKKPMCNYCGEIVDSPLSQTGHYGRIHKAKVFKEVKGIGSSNEWLFCVDVKRSGCCGTISWIEPSLHHECAKELYLSFFKRQSEVLKMITKNKWLKKLSNFFKTNKGKKL